MKFDDDRKDYHVRVTFEEKDRRAAEDWWREHSRQLDTANAPMRARVVELLSVGRGRTNAPTHAACASLVTDKNSWGKVPSLMLSFLGSGKKDRCEGEYNDLKLACLRQGVFSQCVNVAESINHKQISAVQSNVTKQMINKGPGKLVWWPQLKQTCPSLGDKLVMLVGIDMSHRSNAEGGDGYRGISTTALVANFINPSTGEIITFSDFHRSEDGHNQLIPSGGGDAMATDGR